MMAVIALQISQWAPCRDLMATEEVDLHLMYKKNDLFPRKRNALNQQLQGLKKNEWVS